MDTEPKVVVLVKNYQLLSKVLAVTCLTLLFASIHFLQRFGWTRATGRELLNKDVALVYLGYLLLPTLSVIIFLWHKRRPIQQPFVGVHIALHLMAAMLFSIVHNLLFSVIYYALNPIWQEYSFWLLFKDIVYNYFQLGLVFYLGGILISDLINTALVPYHSLRRNEILKVKDQRKTYFFRIENIAYFTTADNYVKVHCGDEVVLMRESMSSLEKRLDSNLFLRVHRTALVNRNYISQIVKSPGQTKLIMTNEAEIPLSRRRKEVLNLIEQN